MKKPKKNVITKHVSKDERKARALAIAYILKLDGNLEHAEHIRAATSDQTNVATT